MSARTFSTTATTSEGLSRAFVAARGDVPGASGGLVFVSGALADDPSCVVDAVRAAWPGVPACVVPAASVLTERGEFEGMTATVGLLWSGGHAATFATSDADWGPRLREFVEAVATASATRPSGPSSGRTTTVVLFAGSPFPTEALATVAGAAPGLCLFGAGIPREATTLPSAAPAMRGNIVAMALRDGVAPLVGASNACRLLGPLRPVEEVLDGMVLRVDGQSALDLLSSCANEGQPGLQNNLVLAAFDDGDDPGTADRVVVLRPVRGIDPTRQGVLVSPDIRPGMRMTFAVRDAAASRAGLEVVARTLSQHALGSAPKFALYLGSTGRGHGLYGAPDVEVRLLRQRFGDLPIVGLRSAFEIFPGSRGAARLTEYSGVLSLFRAPS